MLALPFGGALHAQALMAQPPIRHFSDSELAAIKMPALAFQPTPEITADYDKYFFLQRPETSFDEAYADIVECDALSSGSSYYGGGDPNSPVIQAMTNQYIMQYGMAGAVGGAIGGAIGSAMADAIWGSAERRRERRVNMRNCMHYKGYDRFGLAKDQWQEFNFEEGNGREEDDVRSRDLMMQARVASGPRPQQEALQP